MNSSLPDLRIEYEGRTLDESDVAADPFAQFRQWLDEAIQNNLPEPNAMTLATVDRDGKPSARMVLLRGLDERGLVFYTNYASRKGRELAENPFAALVVFWEPLHRQIRVEGRVEKVSAEESNEYFHSRPRGSQLSAAASPQSGVIPNRAVLDARAAELDRQFSGEVPRPDEWGGYRVLPELFEFWQGRPNRLHDRLRYLRGANGEWKIERLAP